MTDHDTLENAVAAWVLGATEPEESAQVAAHVETCPTCRDLAARVSRAVEELPLAVEEVAPPPGLRERILAAAAAEPVPEVAPESASPTGLADIVPLRPRREVSGRAAAWGRWQGTAVAALAIAVVGLGAWNVSLSRQLSDGQTRVVALHGTGAMAAAQGNVTYYPRNQFAFVDFSAMPPTSPGKVYELWLLPRDGAPIAAGTFQPDAAGQATLVVHRSMDGMKGMAVTVESGPGGAAAPTGPPGLTASLA